MTNKLCLWSFACLLLLSGCNAQVNKSTHADEWTKVNKFTENIYSGD